MKTGAKMGSITKGIVALGATTVVLLGAAPAQAASYYYLIGDPRAVKQQAYNDLSPLQAKCRNADRIPKNERVKGSDVGQNKRSYQAWLDCYAK